MTHQQAPGSPLTPYAISLIRTVVPLAWGYAAAWLIHLGLPAAFLAGYQDTVITALGAVATAGWYALWRWLETRLPKLDSWSARLVVALALGHSAAPVYPSAAPVAPVGQRAS